MKSCHIKCACVLSCSVLSRKQPRVSNPSLGDVPVISPYWSGDGNKRLLPGLQLGGWDGTGSEDWTTTGWSLWMQGGKSGLCLSVQETRPGKEGSDSLGTGQWGKTRGRSKRPDRLGSRARVNHDSKVTLIAHKSWGKSISHILFVLKTDTHKSPVPVTKYSISEEMHVDWRRDLGRTPLRQLCMFRIIQHWTGVKHKIQAKWNYARFHFPLVFFFLIHLILEVSKTSNILKY